MICRQHSDLVRIGINSLLTNECGTDISLSGSQWNTFPASASAQHLLLLRVPSAGGTGDLRLVTNDDVVQAKSAMVH